MTHPATLPVDQLLDDCELRRERRSGPGGQHRNKVETAVVIRHVPTGCEASASERRSQAQNRSVAIERLRLKLACGFRTTAASESSPLWQQRSAGGRLRVSATHEDFPAILAECLDRLQADEFDIRKSAERLHVSSSQLVKLLRQHAPAFTLVNDQRQQRGLRVLK